MAIGCSIVRGAFRRIVSSTPCSIGLPQVDVTISPDFLVSLRTVHSRVRAAKHVTGQEPVGDAIHEPLVSGFLPCLSGHALRVNAGARRHGAALLRSPRGTPFGSWFLPFRGALQESTTWHLGAGTARSRLRQWVNRPRPGIH